MEDMFNLYLDCIFEVVDADSVRNFAAVVLRCNQDNEVVCLSNYSFSDYNFVFVSMHHTLAQYVMRIFVAHK